MTSGVSILFFFFLFWFKCPQAHILSRRISGKDSTKNSCDNFSFESNFSLESALDGKEIQPVHPKGTQSWVFIGRTNVEAETLILWPPDGKNWLIWKDPDAGKDWGQEEKETTEDEMVGWHQWLDGHESGWTLGVGNGQRGLACCGSWGRKELDTAEQLNWIFLSIHHKQNFLKRT